MTTNNIIMMHHTNGMELTFIHIPHTNHMFLFKSNQQETQFTKIHMNELRILYVGTEWNKIPYNINQYSSKHCILVIYQYVLCILSWKHQPIFFNLRNSKWYECNVMFNPELRIHQMSWINNEYNKLYYFSSCCNNEQLWNINKVNYGFDMNDCLSDELKIEIIKNFKLDGQLIVFGFCRRIQTINSCFYPQVIKQKICNFFYKSSEVNISVLGLTYNIDNIHNNSDNNVSDINIK